ncbi:MAG: hypothetical protein AAFX78_08040 [Cyanobacteria bacterium J06638_20]
MKEGLILGLVVGLLLSHGAAWAQPDSDPATGTEAGDLRQTGRCPIDLDALMPLLLRDLPSYSNRVIQRARVRDRSADISGYILLSSLPDIDMAPFDPGNPPPLNPIEPESTVQQVFFTTLERQYGISGFTQIQAHHQLFLTLTDTVGWQIVLMQTILDEYPSGALLSEPRDSTYGVVAQGIELWLRDCQAGAIDLSQP